MLSSWLFFLVFLCWLFGFFMLTFWFFYADFLVFLNSVGFLSLKFTSKEFFFMTSVLIISFMVVYWALFYMEMTGNVVMFFISLLLFVLSMILLILSNSFLFLFLGWEGLGLTSFLLIVFYQNWSSFKGGLITILTNRLGDVVLIISFSMWVLKCSFFGLFKSMSLIFLFMLLFISCTKSAQFPFFSWLPAAMAAPTPVSALVHSSTLVTAGIWILIRFNFSNCFSSLFFLLLGLVTLFLASASAMVELDAKKLVALSTLSQLGLMFMSLFFASVLVTLFHLLAHAFAKASLFIMVGSLIHSRFSSQDIRKLALGEESLIFSSMVFLSIASLTGIFFFSGFYSKDFVLLSFSPLNNSMVSLFMNLLVIALTLVYCLKMIKSILMTGGSSFFSTSSSLFKMAPGMFLSLMSGFFGYFFMKNTSLFSIFLGSFSLLWIFLLSSLLIFSLMKSDFLKKNFSIQDVVILNLNSKSLNMFKSVTFNMMIMEKSMLEMSSFLEKFYYVLSRAFFMLTIVLLGVIFY